MRPEQITPKEVRTMLDHISAHGNDAEFYGYTMRAVLIALNNERSELDEARRNLEVLRKHAIGARPHLYEGQCPDMVEGPGVRDPDCPVCATLLRMEGRA